MIAPAKRKPTMSYSRSSPSPRYTSLVAMYRHMHEHGSGEHGLSGTLDIYSLP